MYRRIPFVESERQVIGTRIGMFNREYPVYNTPVTPRENFHALLDEKHPYWMPSIREMNDKTPMLYNNTLGRGRRKDITDTFGVKWHFEPVAGGSISVAGNPLIEDMSEWAEKVKIPDIETWDWEGAAKETEIDPRYPCQFSFVNGFWFERLISFMEFMPAAMVLIDEDYTEDIKGLFGAMTDLGCQIVDKYFKYWPQLDFIEIHDDWGSQQAPFFSMDVAQELFVPFMKQITDRIHSWGRKAMLHSCGHNETRIQCYIDGGFDYWAPQDMNNIEKMYDEYGDQIILAVFPPETDLAQRSEEEQRAAARRVVDRFMKPGKPTLLGSVASRRATPAFEDEVYRYSREVLLDW